MEVGVEVDGPFDASDPVVPSELPGGRIAHPTHNGIRGSRGDVRGDHLVMREQRPPAGLTGGGVRGTIGVVRLGIAHHLGWAVAVTATADHGVADRRRIELIEPALPAAPVHHEGGPHALHRRGAPLDDDALAALVAEVRESAVRATNAALDQLVADLPEAIVSISLRAWPPDFPTDIAVQRRVPYESRADSVMYREVLAEAGRARGWEIHLYDDRTAESEAAGVLGARADAVLRGPRAALGPPWSKDHRTALAATVLVR